MSRFEQPASAVIRQLQDLLQRYRGGFSIIKEFVQNADDAEATQVKIIWTPGIASENHPLLKGPAIGRIVGQADSLEKEYFQDRDEVRDTFRDELAEEGNHGR